MAKITLMEFKDILQQDYLGYSLKTILDRAIVDIFDGLKPSQRRTLDTMKERKVYNLTKSANIEGAVMVRHPHGGVYPTMVKMAQEDYQNIPLLTGKGNWGNHTTQLTTAAASRYTEAKLSEFGKYITKDIGAGYVPLLPNYDGTSWQSQVLPVSFPMCLTQYSSGTAVGYASTIFSFNLVELAQAIEDWRLRNETPYLYPDFATGGYVLDSKAIKDINETGKGTIELRGKVNIINKQELEIIEIPHNVNREDIIEDVISLAEEGKFKEIVDIKDLSGFNPKEKKEELKIWIKIKKGVKPELVIEKLYLKTRLASKLSSNMTVLNRGDLQEVGVWDIIKEWYSWREECLINYTQLTIEKMKKELNISIGISLVHTLFDIEELLSLIRFNPEEEVRKQLLERGSFNKEQLDFIVSLKASQFNDKWFGNQINKVNELQLEIGKLQNFCGSKEMLQDSILKELRKVAKQFGKPRRTEILKDVDYSFKSDIIETMKDTSDYHIVVTKDCYIYKFKTQNDNPKLKPGDEVKYQTILNNATDTLLLFNPKENFAKRVKVSDIAITERNAMGTYSGTLVDFKPMTIIPVDKKAKFYLNIYKEGRVVKVVSEAYKGQQGIKQQNDNFTLLDCLAIYDDNRKLSLTSIKGKNRVLELDSMIAKKDRTGQGILALEDIKEFEII